MQSWNSIGLYSIVWLAQVSKFIVWLYITCPCIYSTRLPLFPPTFFPRTRRNTERSLRCFGRWASYISGLRTLVQKLNPKTAQSRTKSHYRFHSTMMALGTRLKIAKLTSSASPFLLFLSARLARSCKECAEISSFDFDLVKNNLLLWTDNLICLRSSMRCWTHWTISKLER
jgi:hypothetical protein